MSWGEEQEPSVCPSEQGDSWGFFRRHPTDGRGGVRIAKNWTGRRSGIVQALKGNGASRNRIIAGHPPSIAGGGGGVSLAGSGPARRTRPAVIDKDWVAALLAAALSAERLVFVTDVSHAFERFGHADQREIRAMSLAEARAHLAAGIFAPGSMAPKVESAVEFVEATRRPAVITTIGSLERALRGIAGTTIRP